MSTQADKPAAVNDELLILSRQNLPVLTTDAAQLEHGAYVFSREQDKTPDVILIASGSELHLAVAAQASLRQEHNVDARVVSMPSWELFRSQEQSYREAVLPVQIKARVAVEAGSSFGWREWVGEHGAVLGIDRFCASAPGEENFRRFGFNVANIIELVRQQFGSE